MADPKTCPPLTRSSVRAAHKRIEPYIYRTPVATCETLDRIASTRQSERSEEDGQPVAPDDHHHAGRDGGGGGGGGGGDGGGQGQGQGQKEANPQVRLFFKCENQQRIGAFKARGAFHALGRLIDMEGIEEVRRKGVVTHSSGNHAQALALAANTHQVPAHIVMPTISTPSKISGTKSHGANVIFSGSTSEEREAVVDRVMRETGATLVPPYDHPDIILGQGTQALELEEQVEEFLKREGGSDGGRRGVVVEGERGQKRGLDAVIAPIGGGGMLSGIAVALHGTGIKVFGAEPSFEGANDAELGLKQNRRIEKVKTLTIADGLRTPVGEIPWSIVADQEKLEGVFSVTEEEIKAALKLAMERAKLFIEPSAAVPLAVVLYNEEFRKRIEELGEGRVVNIGVVLSGGNTTVEAIAKLFAPSEREAGKVGVHGEKVAENIAG